jgi:hypothetical protein
MGLLDRDRFNALSEAQYSRWATYLDESHNLSGLNGWEQRVLDQYFSECESILVGAAGGGREVIALNRSGYRVEAFECCKPLYEICRALCGPLGRDVRIMLGEPDEVPPGLGIHSGALVGWGGYMHICGRERRIGFLRQLRGHLKTDAPILLSFFVRSANARRHYWVKLIANGVRMLRFCGERVELGDVLQDTFDHWFTEEEIRGELEEAGFALIGFFRQPYGHAVGKAS